MLDLLKFDISARNRASAEFGRMHKDLGRIKGALAGVTDYATRAGRAMRNIGAGLSATVTAPLLLLAKDSIKLYDTQVKAEAAVAQAIRSTGAAAGFTLANLKDMASELQGLTTFGDEDILSNVTAPLLTFTKIQGDVFERAQANVLDMATLLKMDLKSAAILVGKALNDPVKGISALGRSGVQFSEDQKKVIKSLVETGRVAEAQALILQELETQFQGQAQAAAETPLGQWQQLSNAIGDVKEELGEQIVPFLIPLAEKVQQAITWFGSLSDEVKQNIVVFGGLAAAAGPALAMLGLAVLSIGQLAGAFRVLAAVLLANPILAIIAGIATAATLLYQYWGPITEWFTNLWANIQTIFTTAWNGLKVIIEKFAPDWLKEAWEGLPGWFSIQMSAVKTGIQLMWDQIKGLFVGEGALFSKETVFKAWDGLKEFFKQKLNGLVGAFQEVWTLVWAEVSTWPERFVEIGSQMVEGLIRGIQAKGPSAGIVMDTLGKSLQTGFKLLQGIQSPSKVFKGYGENLVEGLALGIKAKGNAALEAMQGLGGQIKAVAQDSFDFVGSVKDGIKTLLKDTLTGAKSFKDSLSGILSNIGGKLIDSGIDLLFKGFGSFFGFAKGAAFAAGAVVPHATGGIVDSPTFFPMAGNRTGLMGEAGPEGILPLTRVGGKLGVHAAGASGAIDIRLHVPEGVTIEEVQGAARVQIQEAAPQIINRAVEQAGEAGRASKGFFNS